MDGDIEESRVVFFQHEVMKPQNDCQMNGMNKKTSPNREFGDAMTIN
jgi:hypothetical protein